MLQVEGKQWPQLELVTAASFTKNEQDDRSEDGFVTGLPVIIPAADLSLTEFLPFRTLP